jgi:hypothetical protein
MARTDERRVLGPRRTDKVTDEDVESPRREMDDNGNGIRLDDLSCRENVMLATSLRRNLDGCRRAESLLILPHQLHLHFAPRSFLKSCVIRGSTI